MSHLNTVVKTFDPVIGKYDIPNFQIDGVQSNIKQYALNFSPPGAACKYYNFAAGQSFLNKVGFQNINVVYNNEAGKMLATLGLDTLGILVNKIDMDKAAINIQNWICEILLQRLCLIKWKGVQKLSVR